MIKYDTLYVCPVCESEHGADEWNEATEEEFGPEITPIEVATPEHRYTCPTCSSVTDIEDLEQR